MTSPEPSDEQLMAAYVEGDRDAFARLFRRWAPKLRAIYQRAGLGRDEADDLVQHCFLQVHRARHDFRSGSRLHPWLYMIALNLRRELFRRRGRKPEQGLDSEGAEPRAPDMDADAPLVAAIVRRALERLSDSQREVIVLHWFEGLSFTEIGELVGASTTAVKVRAHRGYVRLREALRADGVTPSGVYPYGERG